MASQKRKKSFSSSDFRNLRADWLSRLFVVDVSSRVKCSDVTMELTTAFDISKSECGFVVRQCFPNVKRIHSNHVYYYDGIRRVMTVDYLAQNNNLSSEIQVSQPKTQKSNEVLHLISRCMYINRLELVLNRHEKAIYNFPNGNFSHLELKRYRGHPVAVRVYENSIIKEAKVILSLPSYPCLQVLIGVCCDTKPHLLITMFYGNTKKGVHLTLTGLLTSSGVDIAQWITNCLDIAEGLYLMYSSGFVHGALKAENIMLHKERVGLKKWFPVFLNLEEATLLHKDTNVSAYQHDIKMFGLVIEKLTAEYDFEDATDLSDLIELSQLVKIVSLELDLTEVVTHIKKNFVL